MKNEVFISELKKLGITLSENQLEQLSIYYNELINYNSHTNLTSIIDEESVYLKHFYDSLTITNYFDFTSNLKVLDIGTGAGFPGLVLKIFNPNLDVYLLDSNNKKTTFLKKTCGLLKLDVTVITDRAEKYVKLVRESFDVVVSRAVAKTRILCELGLPYLKNNGHLLLMKASDELTQKELRESLRTIDVLHSKVNKISSFNMPIEGSRRNIIDIEKCAKIDLIYPRLYEKILKKPLK